MICLVKTMTTGSGVVTESDKGTDRCKKCSIQRPDRSHHCRQCDSCVKIFDHHCAMLGTCVGSANFRLYALLQLYTLIFIPHYFYSVWLYLNPSIVYVREALTISRLLIGVGIMLLSFASVVFFVFTVDTATVTFETLLKNQTSHERKYLPEADYDTGSLTRNISVFMGNNKLLWLLPFSVGDDDVHANRAGDS